MELAADPDRKRSVLITGANTGIGKELARQLALGGRHDRVVLACRDPEKARRAQQDLVASTGRAVFETVTVDVASVASVKALVASLAAPIDDLVMNAGGSGGADPLALTAAGVTSIFAANVLGHVALFDGLTSAGLLKRTALYVGSEAARGVPKLGLKRPALKTGSVAEFASLCDGSYFRDQKPDPNAAYGQVKFVAAMWMAAAARRHPLLQLVTMSPGNTSGTEIARDFPLPLRLLAQNLLFPVVLPLFGLAHDLGHGAARLADALADEGRPSGHFYASRASSLTGPVVDQASIFPALANQQFQEHAHEAVHRFV